MSFRIKCFIGHLSLSILVALCSMFLIFMVWYPYPLASATGVSGIVLLMLGIDIILGPILTLILAKEGKKGLKVDLSIVLCCQLFALGYGMFNIAEGRPAWLVYYVDTFDVVQANALQPKEEALQPERYKDASWSGFYFTFIPKPLDESERTQRMNYNLDTGYAPTLRPDLYEKLADEFWHEISEKQRPIDSLKINSDVIKLDEVPYSISTGWVPLRAYDNPKVVLINVDNKQIIKIVDINPWQ